MSHDCWELERKSRVIRALISKAFTVARGTGLSDFLKREFATKAYRLQFEAEPVRDKAGELIGFYVPLAEAESKGIGADELKGENRRELRAFLDESSALKNSLESRVDAEL